MNLPLDRSCTLCSALLLAALGEADAFFRLTPSAACLAGLLRRWSMVDLLGGGWVGVYEMVLALVRRSRPAESWAGWRARARRGSEHCDADGVVARLDAAAASSCAGMA